MKNSKAKSTATLEFLFLLDHPRTVKLPVSVLPVSVLWHPKQTGASINSHMPFVLVQQ
jgi:hypothetical protein